MQNASDFYTLFFMFSLAEITPPWERSPESFASLLPFAHLAALGTPRHTFLTLSGVGSCHGAGGETAEPQVHTGRLCNHPSRNVSRRQTLSQKQPAMQKYIPKEQKQRVRQEEDGASAETGTAASLFLMCSVAPATGHFYPPVSVTVNG